MAGGEGGGMGGVSADFFGGGLQAPADRLRWTENSLYQEW